MKRTILIAFMVMISGCATAPTEDIYVVKAFSDRISKVEDALKVDNEKKEFGNKSLTKAQKEFIILMMDYLSK